MTEKEKMLKGELYLSSDKTLVEERLHAKELIFELNRIEPSNWNKRLAVFNNLFGIFGANSFIELPFYCDYVTCKK